MIVGVLQVELHEPDAQSLKDKRSDVKRLKDQVRGKFNVAVAEVDPYDTWQRATVGIAAVGDERAYVQGLLRQVADWVSESRLADVIRVEEEYL
jgi:uncharacterized protein YlxP (DUF503 family)